MKILRGLLASTLVALALVTTTALAGAGSVQHQTYYYDAVARAALSLAVTAQTFSPTEMSQLRVALIESDEPDEVGELSPTVSTRWQRLLRVSQTLTELKSASRLYFPIAFKEGPWLINPDSLLDHAGEKLRNPAPRSLATLNFSISSEPTLKKTSPSILAETVLLFKSLAQRFAPGALAFQIVGDRVDVQWAYNAAEPETAWKGVLIAELLMNRAHQLALTPVTDRPRFLAASFAERETLLPLLRVLEIQNQALVGLLRDQEFQTKKSFQANPWVSLAFEVEFFSPKVVNAIVPNDPELKKVWPAMDERTRIETLAKLGITFDKQYTDEKYVLLTSLFRFDFEKFPYMEPMLHLEESGRAEIMTNGRGISDIDVLKKHALRIFEILSPEQTPRDAGGIAPVGYHFHAFVPSYYISRLSTEEIRRFIRLFERVSLYMSVVDYAEYAHSPRPPHRVDSWSLDRYSPKELAEVEAFLTGRLKINNLQQKYHNFGFRPVEGGVDIEIRSVADDVEYGTDMLRILLKALETRDFGPDEWVSAPWLFMEPRHYTDETDIRPFTFEHTAPAMSEVQRAILRKLQFEIYKPSMPDFMALPPYNETVWTVHETRLDTAHLRTNFESNVALPLQKWEDQPFLNAREKVTIAVARQEFLKKIAEMAKRIENDPALRFVVDQPDFFYLASYLSRSQHASKPELLTGPEADRQRAELETLIYEVRRYVNAFITSTGLEDILYRSFTAAKPVTSSHPPDCSSFFKP